MFALLGVFACVSVSVFACLLSSILGGDLVKHAPIIIPPPHKSVFDIVFSGLKLRVWTLGFVSQNVSHRSSIYQS